ncbi:MAG: phosphoserine phosphatase SerB [Campylobacterales bacterium]
MNLAVFDFDSTLMDGETIDFLAKELGLEKEVASITKDAMEGRLDFFESLTKRVALLEGLKEDKVNEICKNLPFIKGAKEIIAYLKNSGFRVFVFSGGFTNATTPARGQLGFDMDFSNTLHAKDGVLSGKVAGEMCFSHSKGAMIQKLQKIFGVQYKDTLVVGDGANDLSMLEFAEKRVAFCAKDILKKEANIIIDEKNLELIKNYI